MKPVTLRTTRLVLDQPHSGDVDAITEYCQDPLFEQYLTTPWPYLRAHAQNFVDHHVPTGWTSGTELTWALRADEEFIGVIALRAERDDVGFWLGQPFRRRGYLSEALAEVCSYALDTLGRDLVRWECVVGNTASAATARAVGFSYTGVGPAEVVARDGTSPPSWHGILLPSDPRTPRDGWPIP